LENHAALVSSAPAAPLPPPSWAEGSAAFRAVYPDSAFIAEIGYGSTREAAETDAAAGVARFISSQITSTAGSSNRWSDANGVRTETAETSSETFVRSQLNIVGLRYARDAYYNETQKQWQTVAYIERAAAWRVYEPSFKRQAESFEKLFDAAESEDNSFKKVLHFRAADRFTRTDDFINMELFGQIIDADKMNAAFAEARTQIASLPEKIHAAAGEASVYIDCSRDFESLVARAFSDCFAAEGFPVSKSKNSASAICSVAVDEGEQKRNMGVFYYPSLRAEVRNASGVLFSMSATASKQAAVTADVAKRRAYTALAEEVRKTFQAQFDAYNAP
jgi:hypothetical protein